MSSSLDKVKRSVAAVDSARDALHASIREAAKTERVQVIAEASGYSRQRIYQIIGPKAQAKTQAPSREAMEKRLAELDARWEALVDEVAEMDRPPDAHIRRETAKRNGRRGVEARRGLPPRPTVLGEARSFAEAKLLRTLHDHAEDSRIVSVLAEIVEANALRDSLEAIYDRSLGLV